MPKLQFRILYREFLFRMVDLELLAPQGDIRKLLGQFAALLIVISVWVFLPTVMFAGTFGPTELGLLVGWMAQHFLIATTMLVVGLFAVLSWESMFPDRRDVLVLAPLPVRARTLFSAKVAAVATALSIAVLALQVLPSLAVPFAFAGAPKLSPPSYDAALPPAGAAGLQSVLDRDLAPVRNASVTIGVSKQGVRRVFSYGAAQPDSIFEIGSITKTFTGLLLAKMAAEGKVKLDEPVRELLPAGIVDKPKGGEITLLDLATQHSGLPGMPDNFSPGNPANPYADYHAANLYAYLSKHGVAKAPGVSFLYSNLGLGLLGQALADRAQTTYRALLQREITGPLGMHDTVVSLSPEQQERFIPGYQGMSNRPVHAWDLDGLAGAGAIRSTAGDMLVYLEAQLHPEKAADGALATALLQSHTLRADAVPGMRIALAWLYETDTGTYLHSGATGGYTSHAFFHPQGDYAAVVLVNSGPGLAPFSERLGKHIRQRLAGQPAISLTTPLISEKSGAPRMIRSFAAYWIAMLGAGMFIFCLALSVQGLAQLLPRQWFLRVSSFLQMSFFCLLLGVYFMQPGFEEPEVLAANQGLLSWLPSYWFFGLFQKLNGPGAPVPALLVRRAWMGLAMAISGAAGSYLICYLRTLRKIVEQPDILPARRGWHWSPRFGAALETAVVVFSVRTLARSRQHRVILAFYLGIALGLAIFFGKAPILQRQLSITDPWHQVNAPMLTVSVLMMCCAVMGTRVVFAMPLDLRANWMFRIAPIRGGPASMAAARRALLVLSVAPVWAGAAAVFLWMWPWRPALGHLVVLGLVGMIVAELSLRNFPKIPFTCSYLPGKSYAHMAIIAFIGMVFLVTKGADLERQALGNPAGYGAMLVVFAGAAVCARWRARGTELRFEEEPTPAIFSLNLRRDGASGV